MFVTEANQGMVRRWATVVLPSVVVLVLWSTLYPFTWQCRAAEASLSGDMWRALAAGRTHLVDIIRNILFFVPLGFALSALVVGLRSWLQAAIVLLSGFVLSLAVESAQLCLASRFAALADVVTNLLGTGMGLLLFRLVGPATVAMSSSLALVVWRALTPRRLRLVVIPYSFLVLICSAYLQPFSRPSNWGDTHALLFGIERGVSRPWEGRISEVLILDHPVNPADLDAQGRLLPDLESQLLAAYSFGAGTWSSRGSVVPLLLERGPRGPILAADGAYVGAEGWLTSAGDQPELARAIRAGGAIGIVLRFAPTNFDQAGPARILTFSRSPARRNITIAQFGSDMVVRLRTPFSGVNGAMPQFVFNNIFTSNAEQTYIVSYDGARLRLYVNGHVHPTVYDIGPGAILASWFTPVLPHLIGFWSMLYLVIAIVPWSVYLARSWQTGPAMATIIPLGGMLGFVVVHEAVRASIIERPWEWQAVGLPIVVGVSIAAGLYQLARICADRESTAVCARVWSDGFLLPWHIADR
jgi:glycopeptide antibiotics resistance protein